MNDSIITPPIEGKVVEFRGMRVRELIEKLQEKDPEAVVVTIDYERGEELATDVDDFDNLWDSTRKCWERYEGLPSDAKFVVIR